MDEDAAPSTSAGVALKSARKTRGGYQASTPLLRSRIVEFIRRVDALCDRSDETRNEALTYLGSLEAGRGSILGANFAVIDVIRAHFPDAEDSENIRMQSCLNDIDRDITMLRCLIESCAPDPTAGPPGESIA